MRMTPEEIGANCELRVITDLQKGSKGVRSMEFVEPPKPFWTFKKKACLAVLIAVLVAIGITVAVLLDRRYTNRCPNA